MGQKLTSSNYFLILQYFQVFPIGLTIFQISIVGYDSNRENMFRNLIIKRDFDKRCYYL